MIGLKMDEVHHKEELNPRPISGRTRGRATGILPGATSSPPLSQQDVFVLPVTFSSRTSTVR